MDEKKLAAILAALIVIAIIGWFIAYARSPNPIIEETQQDIDGSMRDAVGKLDPVLRLDPVKRCEVYKKHGCSHVDGPLCDVETCSVVVEAEERKTIPIKQVSNG